MLATLPIDIDLQGKDVLGWEGILWQEDPPFALGSTVSHELRHHLIIIIIIITIIIRLPAKPHSLTSPRFCWLGDEQ